MVKGILGKKIGMTRVFRDNGESVPVSVLEVGPCYIIQIKRVDKEGYNAIQIGFQSKKDKRINKPLSGHLKAAGKGGFYLLREIKVDDIDEFELGQEINSEIFNVGDLVTVRGTSKGRGFSGVLLRGIKREEVERGQVVAKPASITPHTKFKAEAYILTKEEGGRHTPFFIGYRPQFYFRTTDVTGVVTLPEGVEMVMPGDNISFEVNLINSIAMEKELRFAIREGGRTVGAGVISEIVE